MRRVPSIDALIPALFLKGISTGDFTECDFRREGGRLIGHQYRAAQSQLGG
jgi:hypothetical protein